ncbi:MAG: hypothetical protein HYY76_07720 [Acidobacteria bacterium]|nr:hypothetical protein [Acidobacteriota bacterium]
MKDPNLPLLEAAVKLLQPLLDELVFVGGCATGLLITDPGAGGIRPTKDVDTITEVASYAEYATLSERLRGLKLQEDHREGAPTCRWRYGDLTIDVMPTDKKILGFSNRWYEPAIASAHHVEVAGLGIRLIRPAYFLATKFEAFRGRGNDDYSGSHDLEDAIAVIDGRPEIIDEVRSAAPDVRNFTASEMRRLLGTRLFIDALPGFLLPDPASQARYPVLRGRLDALAASEDTHAGQETG